jgi:hypothetical protein
MQGFSKDGLNMWPITKLGYKIFSRSIDLFSPKNYRQQEFEPAIPYSVDTNPLLIRMLIFNNLYH